MLRRIATRASPSWRVHASGRRGRPLAAVARPWHEGCRPQAACHAPVAPGGLGAAPSLVQRRAIARDAYEEMYRASIEDKEGFWAEAAEGISWITPYKQVLDSSNPPFYKWFPGGELNFCYNAIDRHVDAGNGGRVALFYDSPMTGTKRAYTYRELQTIVSQTAGMLASLGVEKGDAVLIYMPMIPEAVFAMLACARLGAPHSVVFGGFPAKELAVRIDDARPKVMLTASCGVEPKGVVPYKPIVDDALTMVESPPASVVVKQRDMCTADLGPADYDWDETARGAAPQDCVPVGSNDPLYILYTSGTTGMPKGIVRDTAGHAVQLKWMMDTFMSTFPGETYWAASDVGWVVGHSYIVYGPLLQGCSTVLYEGKPVGCPEAGSGAFWRVIEEYKVKSFFVAPTGLRVVRQKDPQLDLLQKYDTSSLENLFVAGERCDPDTSRFFASKLGVGTYDNWWQTETGSPICGFQDDAVGRKDGSTSLPMPGYALSVVAAEDGSGDGHGGALVAKLPLPPGTFPTLWNDAARYKQAYFSSHAGYYTSGDVGVIDDDGYVTVLERDDDVMNVAGHRLSSGTIEAAIKAHEAVNDCAVVGAADPIKGQVPLAMVVLMESVETPLEEVKKELNTKVRAECGGIATLAAVGFVDQLPKTRSGKVLRKNIRGLADGKPYPVPGTIENPAAMQVIEDTLKSLGLPKRETSPGLAPGA